MLLNADNKSEANVNIIGLGELRDTPRNLSHIQFTYASVFYASYYYPKIHSATLTLLLRLIYLYNTTKRPNHTPLLFHPVNFPHHTNFVLPHALP